MNDRIEPLEIQKYIKLSQKKGIISFAAGLPDLSVLPIVQLKEAYSKIINEDISSFQYQAPIESLKKKIQSMMAAQSVHCKPEEILITHGAQQAIYLTANLFLKQKSPLMIEEFVYPGFLQIANMFDLEYLPIYSSYKTGIDLNCLENVLKTKKPLSYLYIVSNGHNPQGNTLDIQARKDLAYLADKYNFIIIEDDPYGYLNFSDDKLLPLRAYTKNAIYIGSFSKIIAPAVRVGWIVAEQEIIDKLHQLKDMNDLYASNPNHLAVNTLLDKYSIEEIIPPQKKLYKEKRDCMISALGEYMNDSFNYITPQHGMFIWLELSGNKIEHCHDKLFEKSKVLYIPAAAFAIEKFSTKHAIRLNFTYPSMDEINLGIKNLSTVFL